MVTPVSGVAHLLAPNDLTNCGPDFVAIVGYCLHFDVRGNLHSAGFTASRCDALQHKTRTLGQPTRIPSRLS